MQIEDDSLLTTRKQTEEKPGEWLIVNECLHRVHRLTRNREWGVQLVVPKELREEIMKTHHDDLLAGHVGYYKTLQRINQWYWWPGMANEVDEWVKTCKVCQQHKRSYQQKVGKMIPIEAERPFEIMGLDILTSLPTTVRGNKHILVFTDYYTKWPEAFPIPDLEAEMVARVLVTEIFCRHGAPERIITDRGSQFMADVFREVTKLLGIKHSPTTAYHPQSDGQAERMIGTLHNILARMTSSIPGIPFALYAYRTSIHATTKETPYFLVYGRDTMNPGDSYLRQWVLGQKRTKVYSREVAKRLQEAKGRVKKEVQKEHWRAKERYDRNRQDSPYRVGHIVWLDRPKMLKDENRKLTTKWSGPYCIFNVPDEKNRLIVDIRHIENPQDEQQVNVNRLKRAVLRPGEIIPEDVARPESDPPSNSINKNKEMLVKEMKEKEKIEEEHTVEKRRMRNRKGKTIFFQRQNERDKDDIQHKKPLDEPEEVKIEKILGERKNRKKNMKEYLIQWKGFPPSHNEWVLEKFVHAEELLNSWKRTQKLNPKVPQNRRRMKN